MWKFAWPSLAAHGSLSSLSGMVGMSEVEAHCSGPNLLNEAMDALVDKGGVGIPARFGVILGVKVPSPSAIVGDWRGECTWLRWDSKVDSTMGGRRGVEA